MYSTLNRRLSSFFQYALIAYGLLVLVYAFVDADVWFTAINIAFLITAVVAYFLIEDKIYYFLVTHEAWMFSFNTYAYSAFHFKGVNEGLFDPVKTSLIGLVFHAAAICAAFLVWTFQGMRGGASIKDSTPVGGDLARIGFFRFVLIGVGAAAYLIAALFPVSVVLAVCSLLQNFLWIGLAIHIVVIGGLRFDLTLVMVSALLILVALMANARHYILILAIFIGFTYLIYARRLIDYRILVLAYVAIQFLSVFSSISLDIRLNGGRDETRGILAVYSEQLLSAETLLATALPFYEHSSLQRLRAFHETHYYDDTFKTEFFRRDQSLSTRFVVMPHADIVCGRLGYISEPNWTEISNLIVAALPNFGIEKTLFFSDRLTWELGLRSEGNIGYPMITAACEFYAMGGWLLCFVLAFTVMILILAWYKGLKKAFNSNVLFVLMITQLLIFVTISNTGLSLVATAIRGLPFVFIVVILLRWISSARLTRA